MVVLGIVALVFASFLQCWYSANAGMEFGHAATAFFRYRRGILLTSILFLCGSIIMIWIGSAFLYAVAALIVYFFILPLLILPLLQRIYKPAPSGTVSHAERERKEQEWEAIVGKSDPPRKAPIANDFWLRLFEIFSHASVAGEKFVDVKAGDLHKIVGWYPGPNHRMPICCRVMREEMQPGDFVVEEPPKGAGASLTIRYFLPRAANTE